MADQDDNIGPHGEEDTTPRFGGQHNEDSSKGHLYDAPDKTVSRNDLADAESSGVSSPESDLDTKESNFNMGGGFYKGAESTAPGRVGGLRARALTKRNGMLGGGIGAVVAMFIAMFTLAGSSELILISQQMLGNSNGAANASMEERYARNIPKTLKRMHNEATFAEKFNNDVFREKMARAGFNISFDKDSGTLRSISYDHFDAEGRKITIKPDLNSSTESLSRQLFNTNTEAGRQALKDFRIQTGGFAATWRGRAVTKLWAKTGVNFKPWLNESPSDKAKTNRAKFASIFRKQLNDPDTVTRAGTDPREKDTEGKPMGELKEMPGDLSEEAEKTRKNLEDPNVGKEGISGYDADTSKVASDIEKSSDPDIGEAAKKALTDKPGAYLGKIAGSLNLSGYASDACTIKGAMSYAQYIKSVPMAYQASKIAVMYTTAGQDQRQGILTAGGANLYMQYLRDTRKSGKSYTQAGGFQSEIMGKTDAVPNKNNVASFSIGKSNQGTLARINTFLDTTPPFNVATDPASCKVATNMVVQIGGTVAGGALAIVTAGSSTVLQTASRLALAGVQAVAVQLTQVMIIKSAAGVVANGLDDGGEEHGDLLASGWGSTKTMANNVNGLRPTTQAEAGALEEKVKANQQFAQSDKSFSQRYLDFNDSTSLAGSMMMSSTVTGFSTHPVASIIRMPSSFNSSGLFINTVNSLSPRVHAATGSECTDKQVKDNKIKASAFCTIQVSTAPKIDLDEAEATLKQNDDIDTDKQPTSKSFKEYVEQCHSGRPDLLYKPLGEADTDDIMNGRVNPNQPDDTCISKGPTSVDGKSYPKGQYITYTAWYGYLVDEANLEDFGNNNFPDQLDNSEEGAESAGSDDPESTENVKQLAKDILATSNITYPLTDSLGQNAKEVLESVRDTGKGFTNSSDPLAVQNRKIVVSTKMLQAILEYGKDHPLGINAITNGDHSPTSSHYKGTAVDFECNVPLDREAWEKIARKYGGSNNGETCSSTNHWHYDF